MVFILADFSTEATEKLRLCCPSILSGGACFCLVSAVVWIKDNVVTLCIVCLHHSSWLNLEYLEASRSVRIFLLIFQKMYDEIIK